MNKKMILILISISVLAFSYLIVGGQKRFVLWEQVTQHKVHLLANKPHYYCDSITERDLRLRNKFAPINKQKSEYQNLYQQCLKNLPLIVAESSSTSEGNMIEKYSHFIRITLLYPLVYFSYYFEFNMHIIFSFCCLFLILLMSWLINNVSTSRSLKNFMFIYLFYLSTSLFMNGRMIICFFAFNLLIWICNKKSLKDLNFKNLIIYFGTLIPAFIFSNISSSANIFMLVFYMIYLTSNKSFLKNKTFLLLIIPILLTHIFFSFISLIKNFLYYGQDFSVFARILNHGLGEVRFAKLVFLVLVLAGIYILIKYSRKIKDIDFNLKCGLICILGVFYSYSILMFSIPFLFFYTINHPAYISLNFGPLKKGIPT